MYSNNKFFYWKLPKKFYCPTYFTYLSYTLNSEIEYRKLQDMLDELQ